MPLWMEMLVGESVASVRQFWNFVDIHGSQMLYANDSVDPLRLLLYRYREVHISGFECLSSFWTDYNGIS